MMTQAEGSVCLYGGHEDRYTDPLTLKSIDHNLHAFLSNLCNNDGARLCRECNCAVDGVYCTEGSAIECVELYPKPPP